MLPVSDHLQGILETLPSKPGCYLMKNKFGKVIYIGKAVHLRNRVRSYFHSSSGHSRKIRRMLFELVDIEWIIVGSELESLILEMNLIKRYLPEYNRQRRALSDRTGCPASAERA